MHQQPCFADDRAGFIEDDDWQQEHDWVLGCLAPKPRANPPQKFVFLIGDSHSAAIAPGLLVALEGAASVVWVSIGFGCGYVSQAYIDEVIEPNDDGMYASPCNVFNRAVDAALEQHLQPCDVVIIHHRAWEQFGAATRGKMGTQVEQQKQRLLGLQQRVDAKGAKLVLLGDVPVIGEKAHICAASTVLERRCEIEWAAVQEQHAREKAVYTQLAQHPSTTYIPLDHLMCGDNGRACDAFIPGTGTFAYSDDNHLTPEGSIYLWPFLCAAFEENNLIQMLSG
jgi:hypothetical protein